MDTHLEKTKMSKEYKDLKTCVAAKTNEKYVADYNLETVAGKFIHSKEEEQYIMDQFITAEEMVNILTGKGLDTILKKRKDRVITLRSILCFINMWLTEHRGPPTMWDVIMEKYKNAVKDIDPTEENTRMKACYNIIAKMDVKCLYDSFKKDNQTNDEKEEKEISDDIDAQLDMVEEKWIFVRIMHELVHLANHYVDNQN